MAYPKGVDRPEPGGVRDAETLLLLPRRAERSRRDVELAEETRTLGVLSGSFRLVLRILRVFVGGDCGRRTFVTFIEDVQVPAMGVKEGGMACVYVCSDKEVRLLEGAEFCRK